MKILAKNLRNDTTLIGKLLKNGIKLCAIGQNKEF
jgi:hypothetical protein